MRILGISAYYHDSAAALVHDGEIVAAAQEERFSRKKHDARFPEQRDRLLLAEAGIKLKEIEYIVFYDKPLVKFERLLETYLAYAPKGFRSFLAAMPVWLKEKLYLKATLKKELAALAKLGISELPPLLFNADHHSHAASAFYPSPYDKAAVLCMDGVGEWATTSVWLGEGNRLTPRWEIDFPHSLGLLYSAFTYYTGFKVNSGEYKLMGLAPVWRTQVRRSYPERLDRHQAGRHVPAEHGLFQLRHGSDDDEQGLRPAFWRSAAPARVRADTTGDGHRSLDPGRHRRGCPAFGSHDTH